MSKNIAALYGHNKARVTEKSERLAYNSLIGIEVELEGINAPDLARIMYDENDNRWRIINDGSLRGASLEAVLFRPQSGKRLEQAVDHLCSTIKEHFADRADANGRTSLHVHLDIRDMTNEQLSRLLLIYIIMEKALFNYAGPDRISSNYCIPSINSIDFLTGIKDLYMSDGSLFSDMLAIQDKYAALNLTAISKYGSVEFRHHQGTWSYDRIMEWTNIILSMKRWAVEAGPDPDSLPEYLSAVGPAQLGQEVFGKLWDTLSYPMYEEDCYFCIRRVQDIIYAPQLREGSIGLLASLRKDSNEKTPYSEYIKKHTN